ncbi:hypothetical protein [Sphingobacterium sp. 18053]|uniref:hypothetical protein n=1 Tax=Sphingobacterium sp. 18053 TaxID=2681401 RepID=UPI00135BADF0|nr:hypothetical protein [Sphingobacterium sp. 18053]
MEIDVNGIITTDDKNIVTISLPMTVIEKINQQAVNCTPLFKTKLYFLIWLINRGDKVIGQNSYYSNSYQLHIRAHKQVFTTKNELQKLIKFLFDNQLIEVIGEYGTNNKKARTYRVIDGWTLKNKSNELIHLDVNIYTFARHFQDLNYLILPLSTKRPKPHVIKEFKSVEVVKYEELINKLIEENRELKEQIKSLIQPQSIVIEEYNQDDSDIIEEEIEVIKESGPTVIEDCITTFKPNDIYTTEIIDLMNRGIKEFDDIFVAVYSKYFQVLDDEDMKMEVIEMLSSKIEEFIGE